MLTIHLWLHYIGAGVCRALDELRGTIRFAVFFCVGLRLLACAGARHAAAEATTHYPIADAGAHSSLLYWSAPSSWPEADRKRAAHEARQLGEHLVDESR